MQLKSDIPSVVSLRKAYILVISRDQLPIICTSYKLVPRFRMANVASPSTNAQKSDNEVHEWNKALILGAGVSRTASMVTFPSEAFNKNMVMAIELESSLRLLCDLLSGENGMTSKIKHEKNGRLPEHYIVLSNQTKSNHAQFESSGVLHGVRILRKLKARSLKNRSSRLE